MDVLMGFGTPFATLLHGGGTLDDDEVDPFFDGVHHCIENWLHAVHQQVGEDVFQSDLHSVVSALHCLFMRLLDEDDPWVVYPLRAETQRHLVEFEHVCSDMARCFTHPPRMKRFYHNLSSRARSTFENLVEAEE